MTTDLTSLFDKDPAYARQITQISSEIARLVKENYSKEYGPQSKLASFQWNIMFNGDIYILTFNLPYYWKYLEYGTSPHDIAYTKARQLRKGGWIAGPPIKVLTDWLTVKKGVPQSQALGKAIAIDKNIYYHDKKIHHPGTRGKAIVSWTLHEHSELVQELAIAISNMIQKDVTNEVKTIFDGLECFDNQ